MKIELLEKKESSALVRMSLDNGDVITFSVTLHDAGIFGLVVDKLHAGIDWTLMGTLPDDDSFPWEKEIRDEINKLLDN